MKKYNKYYLIISIFIGLLALNRTSQATINDDFQSILSQDELENSIHMFEQLQQPQNNPNKVEYDQVIDLLKRHRIEDARAKISELLKQNPNQPNFHNLQALLGIVTHDKALSKQSFKNSIEIDSNGVFALYGLAKLAFEEGQLKESQDFANRVLKVNNKIINAQFLLADVAYVQSNYSEAEQILLNTLKSATGNVLAEVEVVNNLGRFYQAQNQTDKILQLSQSLSQRYPKNPNVLSLLAQSQILNNQPEEAEKTLRTLLQQKINDVNHRVILAKLISDDIRKDKEVIDLLNEAVAIDPNNFQARIYKTTYLMKRNRNKEALELAKKIDTELPSQVIGKLLQGDIYFAMSQYDKALAAYQLAYTIQPTNKVLFLISDLLNLLKKPNEAISFLKQELDRNPDNTAIHSKLALNYDDLGEKNLAAKHYQFVLSTEPNNALALNNLAWIYFSQNNAKAIILARKAYEIAPNSAAIADTYGYILLKTGHAKEALDIIEKAFSLDSMAYDIQFHLAEALLATNNNPPAVKLLSKIASLKQNIPEKAKAIELLNTLKNDSN
ncbi:tetratricopeptide repeat protein [Methylotuvimicrobium alcaliphilum]|uniref:Uncharacterized protein n=1 Tax=Methylotuvimicrobium alcaliphilum (strain DSM 19304 / NCIMB 14124 / VKM B-2133 / 20Z) TaxID=1091494 RepID=G4T2U2_META2|nr:tetratricopeptide repeat protein [Methylotuvimicrobium alcaliphilum]CCE22576.1 exported protein of unknown function [Methylotuvimicrobium alcaliphilum 20Z]